MSTEMPIEFEEEELFEPITPPIELRPRIDSRVSPRTFQPVPDRIPFVPNDTITPSKKISNT